MIDFEISLYDDDVIDASYEIGDVDFWVDKMISYPSFRPLRLEKAIGWCIKYCQSSIFKRKLLEKSYSCPVLLHRLFKKQIFTFDEIEPILRDNDRFIISYYFRKEIKNFSSFITRKWADRSINPSFIKDDELIDSLIEFGFHPFTVEYCLKYDDIHSFKALNIINKTRCEWSPFEWSIRPDHLGLLAISGFFGSINCFKYLLMNGFIVDDHVRCLTVCSGSLDLFRVSNGNNMFSSKYVCYASAFFQKPFLDFFIENGADLNENARILEMNGSALHFSAKSGHLCLVEYLINQGADINFKNTQNMTPIHFSTERNHFFVVEYFLNHGAEYQNGFDNNGLNQVSYIQWAVQNGLSRIVEFLIDHGDNINVGLENGNSLLHYAARNGHLGVVECLIKHQAFIDQPNNENAIPLHFSVQKGYLNVVEFLINHGADINAVDNLKNTPLHYASLYGHMSIVELLIDHGSDINVRNGENKTPLHFSSLYGHISIVRFLVWYGAEINAMNRELESPLHYSSQNGYLNIVQFLVENGADINALNLNEPK